MALNNTGFLKRGVDARLLVQGVREGRQWRVVDPPKAAGAAEQG